MGERGQTGKTLAVLAEPRRRAMLEHFVSGGTDVASYDELVQAVLAREGHPETQDDALVQLHHVDLPALEDCGLVEYDPQGRTVRYRGSPIVEETLERAVGADRERSR